MGVDAEPKVYTSFKSFYPFYLKEHSNGVNRALHFTGTTLVIAVAGYLAFTQQWKLAYYIPLIGYGFAWVGHFFFEKNKPATFKYPRYSLMGDFRMWYDIIVGNQPLFPKQPKKL
eukprot:TRINITY_DN19334_c0_g1_i1.p1 TRINITY_DN19334_c0_g1~~TRINITY_DN19334_c0_g1_i1.p1  ORF type:complete len:115 (-),score=40.07 TRINITY_DN19334_c0_g1_i1:176-520(-)